MSVIPFQRPHSGWHRVSPRRRHGGRRGFVAAAMAAVRDWHRRAAARRELAALDERTLHDIGLSRSDTLYLTSKAGERDAFIDSLRFPPF
jgi:uncharacterized protein YjiS (DUF1127 family)